jgi:hypothetical protein
MIGYHPAALEDRKDLPTMNGLGASKESTKETHIGGICQCSPWIDWQAFRISSGLTCFQLDNPTVFPSESYESVLHPRMPVERYDFEQSKKFESFLVPEFKPMIRTPLASGSNVPPWPILIALAWFFFCQYLFFLDFLPLAS